MTTGVFKSLFKDNVHYEQYKEIPFLDSLAYVVQEFLYTEISRKDHNYLYMNGRIRLYDFMTMVVYFIGSSFDDLVKATIKDYIATLHQRRNNKIELENVDYFEDGLLITNASESLVISILWATYIYIKARYKLFKEKKIEHVSQMLYDLMVDEWGSCEEDDDKLEDILTIKRSDEAVDMMIWHIGKKIKEKETIEDNTKKTEEKQKTHFKDQIDNQPREETQKLQLEIANLKNEVSRLAEEKEDLIVELLKPIFKKNEEVVREFLKIIEGKSDVEVSDVARKWVKDSKISDRSKNRPLWTILHAAKYYRTSESNWNTALRTHL